MNIRRGTKLTLKKSTTGTKIEGDVKRTWKTACDLEPGEEVIFFRQFEREGETHYVFHTGGTYRGRRYIITTDPSTLFGLTPEPVSAE